MERKLNLDNQMQNFWKEGITKEDLLRLCWLKRFQGERNKSPARRRELKKEFMPPHIDLPTHETMVHKKQAPVKDAKGEKPKAGEHVATVPLNDMRPVTPEVHALLYDGFSKEEKGRYQYLKARTKKGPNEKYEYAITTSWDYGWNLGEKLLAKQG
ncbi:protein SPMIP1-like [Heterodontus francisci]|uniref:protein SPMIP1-like n=1 Tax=Heterodontus francisci TaxID=7792 RepID=UPI00355BDED6